MTSGYIEYLDVQEEETAMIAMFVDEVRCSTRVCVSVMSLCVCVCRCMMHVVIRWLWCALTHIARFILQWYAVDCFVSISVNINVVVCRCWVFAVLLFLFLITINLLVTLIVSNFVFTKITLLFF